MQFYAKVCVRCDSIRTKLSPFRFLPQETMERENRHRKEAEEKKTEKNDVVIWWFVVMVFACVYKIY